MRQKVKTYSVVIMSDALTSSKEFIVSKTLIRNSIIAVSILVLVFGFVIFDYLTKYINVSLDHKENKILKAEKKVNLEKIAVLSSNLKTYRLRLKNMEEIKEKIMIIAGLTSAGKIEEVGVGGSSTNSISTANSVINTDNLKNKTDILDTNKINQESIKTEKDLSFVLSVIKEKKTQLASTPSIWPCRGYLSCPFGYRIHPFTGQREFHNGIDISGLLGQDVKATGAGYVVLAERRGNMGNMVMIDHNYGYSTRYGHLASFNVKEGDYVKRGQVIGYLGNTGRSTGPHLHYEVRFYDKAYNPLDFILN